MARGPKKHLKRIRAPTSWMLGKLGGIFATRASQGPHRLRESIPLYVVLKNKLRYALHGREVKQILGDREGFIKIDGKIRRDHGFPIGVMDTISIEKSGENFRLLYDAKGRFRLHKLVKPEEANFKLLRVKHKGVGPNTVPYIVTHDSRTIRFPHPDINVNDTVKYNLKENRIDDWVKCELGNTCMATFGKNVGRIGVITHRERHLGGFDIVHIRDHLGQHFATRLSNIFIIGKKGRSLISLPSDDGIRLSALQEREMKDRKFKRSDLVDEKNKKEHAQQSHHQAKIQPQKVVEKGKTKPAATNSSNQGKGKQTVDKKKTASKK